ncbi:MAG: hypothetical protein COB85_02335 [Bacteroidetes bacterium]|nr:MAG: hypothetical protein COB85_02335 [Bacteroidota bacterium]
MRKIRPTSTSNLLSGKNQSQFIILGSEESETDSSRELVVRKIKGKLTDKIPGVWGTLGKENNSGLEWPGELHFSGEGNDNSKGETLQQIKELYEINDQLNNEDVKVKERFINFDKIDFPELPRTFDESDIPNLRLTVFVSPDEGALVYYQHYRGTFRREKNADVEYILPKATKGHTTNRDRLDYIFPMLPKRKMVRNSGGGKPFRLSKMPFNRSFVVKVLTFKRNNYQGAANKILNKIIYKVNGKDKYKLLKYNAAANGFKEVDHQQVSIDNKVKTLLLIHGTFSTTDGSFGGLLSKEYDRNKKSWLQKTMETGRYKQILAFNHPTISQDAKHNVKVLSQRLGAISFKNNPVDIITTSRGGLVGKYLACCFQNDKLPINKAALITCANGSGYFDTGKMIGKMLSIFKKSASSSGNPIGGIILGIAQFSVEFFLDQPGCRQMTISSNRLNNILNSVPKPHNQTMQFKAITGDWDKILVKHSGLFKKWGFRGIDLIIKSMLGKEHDWVIGTREQKILPPGYDGNIVQVRSFHTQYLNSDKCPDQVHQILWSFL